MLDDLFRADAFAVGQELVVLPVIERDQNLRRPDSAGDRTEHFRAVRMLLDVGQSTSTSEEVQRQVGLGAVLVKNCSSSDFLVASIEIHGELSGYELSCARQLCSIVQTGKTEKTSFKILSPSHRSFSAKEMCRSFFFNDI